MEKRSHPTLDGQAHASRSATRLEIKFQEVPHEEQEMKQRILFLCTHNSARSQMAEGFLRHENSDGARRCQEDRLLAER